jgi:hypothetical protein
MPQNELAVLQPLPDVVGFPPLDEVAKALCPH